MQIRDGSYYETEDFHENGVLEDHSFVDFTLVERKISCGLNNANSKDPVHGTRSTLKLMSGYFRVKYLYSCLTVVAHDYSMIQYVSAPVKP